MLARAAELFGGEGVEEDAGVIEDSDEDEPMIHAQDPGFLDKVDHSPAATVTDQMMLEDGEQVMLHAAFSIDSLIN